VLPGLVLDTPKASGPGRYSLFNERPPKESGAGIREQPLLQNVWDNVNSEIMELKPVLPTSVDKRQLLHQEIMSLLQKGAIEPVTHPVSPGFYVKLFLVQKASGGFRPVMDLSRLNKYIQCPTFKMKTTRSITRTLSQGLLAASLDLQDAYLHIPINKSFRKYLRFAYLGKIYQCRAIPFGLNITPLVFTRMMKLPIKVAHSLWVSVHSFLDD